MSGAYRLLIVSGLVLSCLALEAAAVARADTWTQRRPNSTLYPNLPQTTHTPSRNQPNGSPQWGRYNSNAGSSNNNYNINNNNNWQRNNTAPQYPGSGLYRDQQTPWTRYNQTHPYIQTPGGDRRSNPASTPPPNKNIGWWGFNAPNNTTLPQQHPTGGGGVGGGGGFQSGSNYGPGNWAARANSTRHTTPQPNRNSGWGGAAGFGGQSDVRNPQQPGGFQPPSWGGRPSYNSTAGLGGNSGTWNTPGSNSRPSTPPPFRPNAGGWGAPSHSNSDGPQPNAFRPNSTGPMPLAPAGDQSRWNGGGGFQPDAGSRTPGLAPMSPAGGHNQWNGGDNRHWNAGGNPQWNAGDNTQSGWSANPASNTGPPSSGSVPLAPIGGNSQWNGGGNTQGGSRTQLAPLDGSGADWNGGQPALSYPGGQPQPRPHGVNTNPYANLFN